ncbi:MAG: beta-ketoacyl-ACP synthase II [Acidimicrobiia bacterium]|nr:beta-ketoacyl-ACP synthase II [Acidimicrobiia bacterium]MBP8180714.1 beta-ketoacyl-ACP synthase II [Acidimicrobiia bacterium]
MSTLPTLDRPDSQRVVITGLGAVTPAGGSVKETWETVLAGKSMAAPITAWDASEEPVNFACEVKDFDPLAVMDRAEARRSDRVTQFGVAAAAEAMTDAGALQAEPERIGTLVSTGIGGQTTVYDGAITCETKGTRRVSPFFVPATMPNAISAAIAMVHGLKGPSLCICTACAAGTHSIGEAARMIRSGAADVMLAGGAEATVHKLPMGAFWRMGALSTRTEDPSRACRPFDEGRDGFVMGEGAAVLVLERLDMARERGANIYAEVRGYALTSDAYHITSPSEDGEGIRRCMRLAVADAQLAPTDIAHVNAHGTSTPLNDLIEGNAVAAELGSQALVTSTKGVTGHCIGAAGAIEAVLATLTIRDSVVPPTANLETLDPKIPISIASGAPAPLTGDAVISNSLGFGGHNASLCLSRC